MCTTEKRAGALGEELWDDFCTARRRYAVGTPEPLQRPATRNESSGSVRKWDIQGAVDPENESEAAPLQILRFVPPCVSLAFREGWCGAASEDHGSSRTKPARTWVKHVSPTKTSPSSPSLYIYLFYRPPSISHGNLLQDESGLPLLACLAAAILRVTSNFLHLHSFFLLICLRRHLPPIGLG